MNTLDTFTEAARLWIWNDADVWRALRALCRAVETEADAADTLRAWVEENNPLADGPASLASDLLRRAIDQVDYHALAERLRREE